MRLIGFAAVLLIAISSGCGGDGRPRQTHTVRFDVGGAVAYELDPSEALGGVRVTLGDIDGRIFVATTNSAGLWTTRDLDPGIYSEVYEFAGYERVVGTFALDAFGENDVANPFVARPTVLLEELRLRAAVMPFGIELTDGDEVFDGAAGATLEYSLGASDDVAISLNSQVTDGVLVLLDMMTGDFVVAALDTSTMTSFTISGSQIEGMNSGSGLTASPGPLDLHQVGVTVSGYTPIHGDPAGLQAALWFSAIP